MMQCILASTSPRRKELLGLIIKDFSTLDTKAVEKEYSNLSPPKRALQTSKDKCFAALKLVNTSEKLIIASDTVVECGGKTFGKPKDAQEAFYMIKQLDNRCHSVHSGVSVYYKGVIYSFVETTLVYFDKIADNTIRDYVRTKEPYDKAGGYAIQGFMASYIKKIDGNYHNVVGLPVQRLNKLLKIIKAI